MSGTLLQPAGRLNTLLWLFGITCCVLTGCGDRARRPSAGEVTRFETAGPSGPSVDMDRVARARMPVGPYRLVAGDVVRLQVPAILAAQIPEGTAPAADRTTYDCRVHDDGTIVLPVVGRLAVAGMSLAEVESAVIAQYYPKYVATLPPIHATVAEYKTRRVSIMGSVNRPGVYTLRHDQATLVALLMEAGGIAQRGAVVIRIARNDSADPPSSPASGPVTEGRLPAPTGVVGSKGPAQRPSDPAKVRLVFTPEGPLNTGGWLSLEKGSEVAIRQWLDLAGESQTRAYVQTVLATSPTTTAEELQTKLSCLAAYLDRRAGSGDTGPATSGLSWNRTDDARFVTDVQGTEPGRISTGTLIEGLAAPADPNGAAMDTVVLPVHGLDVPFADVALEDGDSVVVEPPAMQFISVVGLVRTPGNFPYPPNAYYNLIQAIAMAGGLDLVAAPRYVTVYRLNTAGEVVSIRIQLVNPRNEKHLTEALALPLRPGDVVSVESTPRTRTNVFLDRVLRVSLGLYFDPSDLWDDDD